MDDTTLDRRKFLVGSGVAAGAFLGGTAFQKAQAAAQRLSNGSSGANGNSRMRAAGTTGTEDFDPYAFLTDFNRGDRISDLGDGRRLREYDFVAVDKEIEIAPGVWFPAWTYNGMVPGPTIRANAGDRIRINFQNAGSHPHTIHFHGIHTPEMDGIPGVGDGMIEPGDETVYEFDARPYGTHLYHCHSIPLKRHIHKGLYGAFIVDPPGGYDHEDNLGPADHELVMVMNGFDTNFDGDNEIYAVNSKAFAYAEHAIQVRQGDLVRIYLVNTTEFDPVNSFHLHALFYDYYDTGRLEAGNIRHTVDTIMQCQAQRGIIQFRPEHPGPIMFHAHQSEFAELGWLGFFDVAPGEPPEEGSNGPVDEVRETVGDATGKPAPGSEPATSGTTSGTTSSTSSSGTPSQDATSATGSSDPSVADRARDAVDRVTGGGGSGL